MQPPKSFSESNQRISSTTIEYDRNGKRITKTFEDVFTARRFYADKLNSGKHPKIISAAR